MGAIFWAVSASVFAILEIIIPGLVTIWLALAALVVTVFAGLINNPYIEFFIFAVLSLIFILFTRPVLQNYLKKKIKHDFNSNMTGSEIKIEKVVNSDKAKKEYEVKFKGSIWTGISEEFFKVGDMVRIKSFEGNKIVLERK
ncbi:MAG: NfeD family protein [Pseudoleptotrichia goodfellowii]|nr:NfeD family protein [Pseudoleptotrichia goodfellowii]